MVDLRPADAALSLVQDERDRLARERLLMLANRSLLDPLDLQTRADALLALIDVLERFAGDVFPRIARKAEATDDQALADRLADSTRRIAGVADGVRPIADVRSDVAQTARDAADDAKKLASTVQGGLPFVALALVALVALKLLK